MNYLFKLSALIIFSIASGWASAEMPTQSRDEGNGSHGQNGHAYVVVDVGQGTAADFCPTQSAGVACNNNTLVTQFGLGYQLSKNIGIEAGYLSSGEITGSTCTSTFCMNGGGSTDTKNSLSGPRLSFVMSAPVNNTLTLIGKLGMLNSTVSSSTNLPGSMVSTSSSFDNTTVTYGLGALVNLNERIALRVLYENMGAVKASSSGTGSNLTMVSGGLLVNFK